jgi:MSHA pilin protein MshC
VSARSKGFSLTELVVVIVIATILSAFAIARINTLGFDTEGFANRVAAMVRYAQKIAVSQRRTVFVVTTASNIKLCYVDVATPCDTPVREPPGTNAFSIAAPSNVVLSATSFSFDALGRPSAATTITVTGDVARNITVAAETGYVQYVP